MRYDFGTGGFDISFTVPELSTGESVSVVGGMILSITEITDDVDSSTVTITITKTSTGHSITILDQNNATLIRYYSERSPIGNIRVIAHSYFVTVYINDVWITTFHFPYVLYRLQRYVALKSESSVTVTNIRLKELSDWREAIFIDLEASSMNAISSVILQRPVDIWPTWDGKLSFSFAPQRETVDLSHEKSINEKHGMDSLVASDAIAYFTNVAVIVSEQVARDYGFITRLVRLPDLDQDAIQSTVILVDDAIRKSKSTSFKARYNPILELGDIARMIFTRADTGSSVQKEVIVEDMRFTIMDGNFAFEGSGRYGS